VPWACSAAAPAGSLTLICCSVKRWRTSPAWRSCRSTHPPTPATIFPHLRTALTQRIVVEQAKGFLRELLDVSVHDAFGLLRRYARSRREHLTEVSRRLISEPDARPALLEGISQIAAAPPT
jgi:hypothetical protein